MHLYFMNISIAFWKEYQEVVRRFANILDECSIHSIHDLMHSGTSPRSNALHKHAIHNLHKMMHSSTSPLSNSLNRKFHQNLTVSMYIHNGHELIHSAFHQRFTLCHPRMFSVLFLSDFPEKLSQSQCTFSCCCHARAICMTRMFEYVVRVVQEQQNH